MYPSSHVLAMAPSNAAADILCDRLRLNGVSPKQLYRLNWHNRSKSTLLSPELLTFVFRCFCCRGFFYAFFYILICVFFLVLGFAHLTTTWKTLFTITYQTCC